MTVAKLLEKLDYLESLPRYNCFTAEEIEADQAIDRDIHEIEEELRKLGYVPVVYGTGTKADPYDVKWEYRENATERIIYMNRKVK